MTLTLQLAVMWRPDSEKVHYDWLENGWPLEEEELRTSGRRLVRLVDWFLDGNQLMPFTVNMPGELIDENAEVIICSERYPSVIGINAKCFQGEIIS